MSLRDVKLFLVLQCNNEKVLFLTKFICSNRVRKCESDGIYLYDLTKSELSEELLFSHNNNI